MSEPAPILTHGVGSLVHAEDGRTFVDLSMGFGAAFLGHANPRVTAALAAAASRFWSNGRRPTAARGRVEARLGEIVPSGMRLAGLYSTGMEVAEFAMRVAATHTGRRAFAGFSRSMHGKSAMTAALCWENAALRPGHLHTLRFVAEADEAAILADLESLLRTGEIAALFVEPIQGSNAAHEASIPFYDRAIALCRENGTLCVFDEILTGLHRTGTRYYADRLLQFPDLMLFAKSIGNGFPVAALALAEHIPIRPEATPHSTFSGGELALAAIEGTLAALDELDMKARVATIEATVRSVLGNLPPAVGTLRGRGALWCLELGADSRPDEVLRRILGAGLLVTSAGRAIRLLPAATIDPRLLAESCEKIREACAKVGE
jgi:acetylornithine/succinyldiaminopimelate/putrescine aminotransferase